MPPTRPQGQTSSHSETVPPSGLPALSALAKVPGSFRDPLSTLMCCTSLRVGAEGQLVFLCHFLRRLQGKKEAHGL